MKRFMLIMIVFGFILQNTIFAKGFGRDDIVHFCKNKQIYSSGKQPDGKRAIESIVSLSAGKYSYPKGGALLLFSNGYYIMQLPSNRNGIHGTDGDDLLASGGIVGGCSKEQLSEAIVKNNLDYHAFKLRKKYH